MTYGEQLKQLREAAAVPQGVLAYRLGWDQSRLSLYESEKRELGEPDFLRAKAALIELVEEREQAFKRERAAAPEPEQEAVR